MLLGTAKAIKGLHVNTFVMLKKIVNLLGSWVIYVHIHVEVIIMVQCQHTPEYIV